MFACASPYKNVGSTSLAFRSMNLHFQAIETWSRHIIMLKIISSIVICPRWLECGHEYNDVFLPLIYRRESNFLVVWVIRRDGQVDQVRRYFRGAHIIEMFTFLFGLFPRSHCPLSSKTDFYKKTRKCPLC
jgi:hypothetical protein